MKLKPGDVVVLKSESYIYMTVSYRDNDIVKCQWFDMNKHLCEGVFHPESLVLV